MAQITKRFGGVPANDDITFTLNAGEVLALLGENGAGKTTLMNILFGHYVADAGSIEIEGKPLAPGSPQAALTAGVGMVHQHFTIAENLTVADNVTTGTEPLFKPWRSSAASERIRDLATRFGLALDPKAYVRDLSVGERQRVEIVKALYREARILVLDEPTAVLTPQETQSLFETLKRLVAGGISIIFISHKLREVIDVADRVIVLRHGRLVAERTIAETTKEELAELMLGRRVVFPTKTPMRAGNPVLRLDGIVVRRRDTGRNVLDGVNLVIRRHEIMGIAGISGNGQSVLADVANGVTTPTDGFIQIAGEAVDKSSPASLVERGVARIPEDRHATGLIPGMAVWENAVAERYRSSRFAIAGLQKIGAAKQYAQAIIEEFDVRGAGVTSIAKTLSGGNMQKLIIGRTLSHNPSVIIANQPTRGLDIGAVAYVHERLLEARDRGAGILLITEDLDELYALADRIAVMFRGSLGISVRADEIGIGELGLRMAGHSPQAEATVAA